MREYPSQFWVLVLCTFIDRLGGSLLFPFFSLYITRRFGAGMTQVGILFALVSVTSLISSFIGGGLTDRFGRKKLVIFSLLVSAFTMVILGLVNTFTLFILVVMMVGLLADVGFPAQQAMVADLLPEEKRAQGYGILRVVLNLAVVLGPVIGGLLAARSYLLLFIFDGIFSSITALIVFVGIKETYTAPAPAEGERAGSMLDTFKGYAHVMRDGVFTWFLGASMLMVIVYIQMNTSLGVYLRDTHGIAEQAYGYILSLNAAMVVLFQFPITRWIERFRPLAVMVAGTLFYAIGFGMYGFVSLYALFLVAMAIITVGEMFVTPVSQAIVSNLAPEDMRGRYMATYGLSWVVPSAIGPLLAGIVIDFVDPRWVWYGAGLIGLVSAAAFYFLDRRVGSARWEAVRARLDILQRLEEAQISAHEAASLINEVSEGRWAKLAPALQTTPQRSLRIRVSDVASGSMKADVLLPFGLLGTIRHTRPPLSPDLDQIDHDALHDLIDRSLNGSQGRGKSADGDSQVEVNIE